MRIPALTPTPRLQAHLMTLMTRISICFPSGLTYWGLIGELNAHSLRWQPRSILRLPATTPI